MTQELDCSNEEWSAGSGRRKCCCGLVNDRFLYKMHMMRDDKDDCEHERCMRVKK